MQSAPHFRPYGAIAFAAALVLGLAPPALHGQQGIISGTAEDARSGQPLASVQISVGALDIGVLSNAGGSYQLTDVPAGTHTVTAQRLGYETAEGAGERRRGPDGGPRLLPDAGGAPARRRRCHGDGGRHPAPRDRQRRGADGRRRRPRDHPRDECRAAPRDPRAGARDAGGRRNDRGRAVPDPDPRLGERRAPERPPRLHRRRPDEHRPDRGAAADDRAAERHQPGGHREHRGDQGSGSGDPLRDGGLERGDPDHHEARRGGGRAD